MIKKELKQNFKSFLIWSLILIGMLIIVFLIYPSISSNQKAMEDMLKMFPQEMLKLFNMDIINLSTVSGWMMSEGYMFITLICGAFSSIIASNILIKEESDKTIEFLYSNSISKNKIITNKIVSSLIYVFLINFIVFIVNIIGFKLSNDFNLTNIIYISIGSFSISLILYSLTFFISSFYRNVKKTIGIAIGLSLGLYVVKILGALSDKISFLNYLTPYEYFDIRYILNNNCFLTKYIVIAIILCVFCIGGTYYFYNKKEYL